MPRVKQPAYIARPTADSLKLVRRTGNTDPPALTLQSSASTFSSAATALQGSVVVLAIFSRRSLLDVGLIS